MSEKYKLDNYKRPELQLPNNEDKLLLCKRAIDPRRGKWTLPAGFMENGESSLEGALRETMEEAGAKVIIKPTSAPIKQNTNWNTTKYYPIPISSPLPFELS